MRKLPLIFLLWASCVPLRAAFQPPPTGVRASSMGGSLLSSSGDPACLFTDPAGLASVSRGRLSMAYAKPFLGLPGVSLGAGHVAASLPRRVGLGMAVFRAGGLLQEETWALGHGFGRAGIRAGAAAKYVRRSYFIDRDPLAAGDPVYRNGPSRGALSWDAGLAVSLGRRWRLGTTVRNLNRPDLGLASRDRLPRLRQTGLEWCEPGLGLVAAGDLSFHGRGRPSFLLGLEKALYKDFMARAGVNSREWAAGFGFKRGSMTLDYGLVWKRTLADGNSGTHRMGIVLAFGDGT